LTFRKRSIVLAPAAALLACLIGCGSDSSQPLSAEELVSQGDAICREGQSRFAEIQAEPPRSAAEGVDQTNQLIDISRDELGELSDLEPPEELAGAYARYLDARREAIDELERGRDAAKRQDRRAYAKAQDRSIARTAERLRLARAVGFKVCGKGLSRKQPS
jgi:hypothetical protein